MRAPVLLLLGCLALPPDGAAQRLAQPTFRSVHGLAAESSDRGGAGAAHAAGEEISETNLIVGSVLGGIGTFWLTAYVASRFHGTPCEDCGLDEALYGAAIGFGLGSAAGAHLANRRQGPFGQAALIGAAIGVAGMFAAIESDRTEVLLAIPIFQVASAVALERSAQRE